jgi:hypothetical protein
MDRSLFLAQVDLLLRILPYVMRDPRFALKGGSALNLFIRDLPRLSVDIDLTYLPIEDRDSTLANISDILTTISRDLSKAMPQVTIQPLKATDGRLRKLVVRSGLVTVKVEPNETIRGSVFPCELRDLASQVEEEFGLFMSVQTLSLAVEQNGFTSGAVEVAESGENAQAQASAGSCKVEGGTGSLAIARNSNQTGSFIFIHNNTSQ